MSSLSPASVLFDSSGTPLAVSLTSAIPANTSAIINISDGYVTTAAPSYTTGTYNSLSLDVLGNLRTLASQGGAPWSTTTTGTGSAGSPAAGVVTVQGITGGTPLTVSLSGTGNAIDGYVTTAAPAYTNNTTNYLSLDVLGNLRVLASQNGAPWSVSQSGAPWTTTIAQGGNSAIVKNTTPVAGDQALVVAISPNSALNLSTDGYVTTAAPVYVNNTSNLLSLTTAGSLRVQGVAESATGAAVPANADFVGALVVSTPPTNVAGNLNALTETTAGRLIVDGSQVTQPVAGVGTAGTPSGGVLSVQGVSGGTPLTVSLSSAGGNVVDGYVTTAAPAYTNNTSNFLSLDTVGNLRVLANQGTSPWVVSGTVAVTQSTSPWVVSGTVTANAGTGNFTVVQPTASALNVTAVGAGTAGTPSGGVMSIQGVSGGTPLTVTADKSTTGTMTSVSASASSVTVLAANANRVGAAFFNDSTNILYLAMSASAASVTAFTIKCMPNVYTDLDVDYTGQVNGIWNGTNGAVRVTEWT